MNFSGGKKYGLQLRAPASAATKKSVPLPKKPSIFNEDDEEESVEQTLARENSKKRSNKEVEEMYKAALEQDANVFDYDGVYDEMKAQSASQRKAPQEKQEPKYIQKLIDKAKIRQMEQEIIYERKLLKERQVEDHLYGDKPKFITSTYKQKLAEQAKWLEEERIKQLRDEAQDVTKRDDMSDFYRNLLTNNEAFGTARCEKRKHEKVEVEPQDTSTKISQKSEDLVLERESSQDAALRKEPLVATTVSKDSDMDKKTEATESNILVQQNGKPSEDAACNTNPSVGSTSNREGETGTQSNVPVKTDRKPSEEALAAARERFLARKKQRQPQ